MKKTLIAMAVVAVTMLTISVPVLAVGDGYGAGFKDECLLTTLTEEQRAQFIEIIAGFKEEMSRLREVIREKKAQGDYEAFRAAHNERTQAMEARHDALSEILPDDYAAYFKNKGRNMRNYGSEKGSGGFRANQSSNR